MANLVFEFEMCDCAACPGSARWEPRWECGCDEDICPDCGCCQAHCEGDHDEVDWFAGQDDDDDLPF